MAVWGSDKFVDDQKVMLKTRGLNVSIRIDYSFEMFCYILFFRETELWLGSYPSSLEFTYFLSGHCPLGS